MKYIVSINTEFGSISAESKHPEDLNDSLDTLRKLARNLKAGKKAGRKSAPKKATAVSQEKQAKVLKEGTQRSGQGETTVILREIESRLLETGFFDKPETTGDVKSRLERETGKKFTSRKVSQALGILKQKGSLIRAGDRNSYSYTYSKKYLEEKAGL